ncbi:hypothetical protein DOK78_002558 [Enterococcus sp. DIV2402]|uniref:Autolysin n=1 Tax=Candidatus Enterococcus lowellii TaxID=2230877 RepID=A0ABZ2SQ67_9ENTE|nr:ArpU family phage packaging/lysis transcriptional regulator [Enterococcus sp. DIV2402]MBO0463325.1 autolysin [Enterococcus sp. DIV2402]
MILTKKVNLYQTRKNAKNVLKHYRRLERIAGRSQIDIRSSIITDMPRSNSRNNKHIEDVILQRIDAEGERDAIIIALLALKLISRRILYYSFCTPEHFSNLGIATKLGYSLRSIERLKAEALVEFAESYKQGNLISYQ